MYKLVCVVGHLEIERARLYASREAAAAEGEEWMDGERDERDREIEDGNLVAAEIPFFYRVIEATASC